MRIKAIARLAVFLVVAALATWGLYLLVAGLPYSEVRETITRTSSTWETITTYVPYYGGAYSLAALVMVAIGVLKDKWLPLAWVGLLAHLALGAISIWSFGIIYIAATGVLAVPVAILQWQSTDVKRWLLVAWAGVGLTGLMGSILLGTYFGIPTLAIGIVLALLLVGLQPLSRQSLAH